MRYAREHNLGKIILGRPASRRWWRRETFADRLARIAPDLDQVLVALDEPPARTINNAPDSRSFKDKWRVQIQGCVVAAALCAVITLIAMQWLMASMPPTGDAVSTAWWWWRYFMDAGLGGCYRH